MNALIKKLEKFGRGENIAENLTVCYVFILDAGRVPLTF